ncbi:MAG: hypothetical protein K0U41_08000 [Gammaproteobacteria bacterium]|nr:hypothetical protein [Gammaproteobacteria bacterium]
MGELFHYLLLSASLKNAGCRPGSRGPFVSAKGPQTIDAQFGLIRLSERGKLEGVPTCFTQTRFANARRASARKAEQEASC